MKIFINSFFLFLISLNLHAEYKFTYSDVYACSTKKFEYYSDIAGDLDTILSTYIIHISNDPNHFSVIRNNDEYATFKKIENTELYIQSGGIRWLEFNKLNNNITKFTFFIDRHKHGGSLFKFFLIFDLQTMTAIENVFDENKLLMCWKYY